jgi:hypothetical protein
MAMKLSFLLKSRWRSILPRVANTACVRGTALLMTGVLWGGIAQAQVNLSPLLIDVQAQGGQARGVIDIRNTSDRVFRARIYAEPFTYDRETGFKALKSSPTDLRPYLQFSPQEINLPPGALRRVRMTVKLPTTLPEGEYRAMIFTEPLTDLSSGQKANTTTIVTRIGSALFVHQGNVNANLTVDRADWNAQIDGFQLLVRNSGKASIQSTANWSLSQGGKVIQTGETPLSTVIAEGDRYLGLQIDKSKGAALPTGTYQLTGTLTSGRETKQDRAFSFNVTVPPASKKTVGSTATIRP